MDEEDEEEEEEEEEEETALVKVSEEKVSAYFRLAKRLITTYVLAVLGMFHGFFPTY